MTYKYGGAYNYTLLSPDGSVVLLRYYNKDGEMTDEDRRFYDEKGNMLRIETVKGTVYMVPGESIVTYDAQGRLIREEIYKMNAESSLYLVELRVTTYSNDGLRGKTEYFDENGVKCYESLLTLDANGRTLCNERRDTGEEYYLDENGDIIRKYNAREDGALSFIRIYTYDENGNLIRMAEAIPGNKYQITERNKNADIIKRRQYYDDGRVCIETFTETGNPFMRETFDTDGSKTTELYTEKGALIEKTVTPPPSSPAE